MKNEIFIGVVVTIFALILMLVIASGSALLMLQCIKKVTFPYILGDTERGPNYQFLALGFHQYQLLGAGMGRQAGVGVQLCFGVHWVYCTHPINQQTLN